MKLTSNIREGVILIQPSLRGGGVVFEGRFIRGALFEDLRYKVYLTSIICLTARGQGS